MVRIELLGPKAKHPLEKSLRHFVSKDPRLLYLFFFLSALVGVENVFNFSRETGVTKKIKQMAADLYNTKTDAKIGSNFV